MPTPVVDTVLCRFSWKNSHLEMEAQHSPYLPKYYFIYFQPKQANFY